MARKKHPPAPANGEPSPTTYPPLARTKTEDIAYHRQTWSVFSKNVPRYLYNLSFSFCIFILAALLAASAFGLGEQAWRTSGGQKRWNIAILSAVYVAVGVIAVLHVWSRVLSVKKVLRTMPKPYIPTKRIDVPKIISQPSILGPQLLRTLVRRPRAVKTDGASQVCHAGAFMGEESWALMAGTRWENTHFRTYILATVPEMKSTFGLTEKESSRCSPISLDPILDATIPLDGDSEPRTVRLLVNSWAAAIQKARFGRNEPGELDADNVEKLVQVIRRLVEKKRARLQGGTAETDDSEDHGDG